MRRIIAQPVSPTGSTKAGASSAACSSMRERGPSPRNQRDDLPGPRAGGRRRFPIVAIARRRNDPGRERAMTHENAEERR